MRRPRRRSAESAFWSLQSRTWDERYGDPAVAAHVDELAGWLADALAGPAPSASASSVAGRAPVVADLGCGTGAHAAALGARGVAVVGLERSPGMAARAAAKGVAVVRCDLGAGGAPLAGSSLDGALSVYCLQFLDAVAVLTSVARVLRPGAPLVVEVPRTDGGRRSGLGSSPSWGFRAAQRLNRAAAFVGSRAGVVKTLTAAELDRLLDDAGFDVVEHRDTARSVAALARLRGRAAAPDPRDGRPSRS